VNTNEILKKLASIYGNQQKIIYKLAQSGVGVRVKFHHPQYFAKFARDLFENALSHVGNDAVSVEIYHDRVTFFDGAGTMDGSQLQNLVKQACAAVEQNLNLNHGELFNYNNLEFA
jgi:hypothetical protein